jgi:hypothetical protein
LEVLVNVVTTPRRSAKMGSPAITILIVGMFLLVSLIGPRNFCPKIETPSDGAAALSELGLCQNADLGQNDKGGRHRETLCLSCAVASPPVIFPASMLIIVRSVVYDSAPTQFPSAECYQVLGWATTWSSRAPPIFA